MAVGGGDKTRSHVVAEERNFPAVGPLDDREIPPLSLLLQA